ncbi:MAG TPA: hypothetical protein VF845_12375, partial [Terriglobales bacterium]
MAILIASASCLAQAAGLSEQETIRLLVQQVKELQERVNALDTKQASQPSANPDPPALARPLEESASGLPTELAQKVRGIEWRGFGEVNYKILDQRTPELGVHGFVPGSAGNFYTGDFDLFLTSRINDKASVLSEIVFGEGDAQSFGVDLERFLLKYDYNDHLKLSFGRYHTGIGYYNTAFHSGKWLQTTADRPLIMEFAAHGGVLPTQAIGVSVTGLVPSGRLGLHYLVEYGSSDTIRPDIDGSGVRDDENNGNSINVGFFARPDSIRGLQLGTSFYHDKISYFQLGPSVRLGQTIVNGHVVYVAHGVEFLNEGFLIRHAFEHSSTSLNTSAFYTQFSKRIGHMRPFFRYQYINASQRSLFEDVGLRHGPSFGTRYDLNDNVALK